MELISLAVISCMAALALGLAKWFSDKDDDSPDDSSDSADTRLGIPPAMDPGFGLENTRYPGPGDEPSVPEEPATPAPLDEVTSELEEEVDSSPAGFTRGFDEEVKPDGQVAPAEEENAGPAPRTEIEPEPEPELEPVQETGSALEPEELEALGLDASDFFVAGGNGDDGPPPDLSGLGKREKKPFSWAIVIALMALIGVFGALGVGGVLDSRHREFAVAVDKNVNRLNTVTANQKIMLSSLRTDFEGEIAQLKEGNELRDESIGELRKETGEKFDAVIEELAKKASKGDVDAMAKRISKAFKEELAITKSELSDEDARLDQEISEVRELAVSVNSDAKELRDELSAAKKKSKYWRRKFKKELKKRPIIDVAEQKDKKRDPVCPDGAESCHIQLTEPAVVGYEKSIGFWMPATQILPCPDGSDSPCVEPEPVVDGEQSFARIEDPSEEDSSVAPKEDL